MNRVFVNFFYMLVKYIIRPVLVRVTINSLALYGVIYLFPDKLEIYGGILAYVLAGIVIGLLNMVIKPVIKLLSFPFIMVSMGLFMFVINGFIFYLALILLNSFTGDSIAMIVNGGFLTYMMVSFIFGLLNWVIGIILKK